MRTGDRVCLIARPLRIIREAQQSADVLQWESQFACMPDEGKPVTVGLGIEAMSA